MRKVIESLLLEVLRNKLDKNMSRAAQVYLCYPEKVECATASWGLLPLAPSFREKGLCTAAFQKIAGDQGSP